MFPLVFFQNDQRGPMSRVRGEEWGVGGREVCWFISFGFLYFEKACGGFT